MRDIGKNIRKCRVNADLSQDELAARLFVSRQTISNYETGRSRPDIETLAKLADIFNVDIHELIYGVTNQKTDTAEDRKKRVITGGTGLAGSLGLALASYWLDAYAHAWASTHFRGFFYLLSNFYIRPVLYFICGWLFINGIARISDKSLFGAISSIKPETKRIIRIVILIFAAVLFANTLPCVAQTIAAWMKEMQAKAAGAQEWGSSFTYHFLFGDKAGGYLFNNFAGRPLWFLAMGILFRILK